MLARMRQLGGHASGWGRGWWGEGRPLTGVLVVATIRTQHMEKQAIAHPHLHGWGCACKSFSDGLIAHAEN